MPSQPDASDRGAFVWCCDFTTVHIHNSHKSRPYLTISPSIINTSWIHLVQSVFLSVYHTAQSMVYLPPPQFETPQRPGYERAYHDILSTHRRSPLSSASSLIMLVAPDVDALCASRILADLLKQDDIMHRTIPVSGLNELERIRDDLVSNSEVRPRSRD